MATITIIDHPELELTEKVAVGELTTADIFTEIERSGGSGTKRVLWELSQATFNSLNVDDVAQFSAKIAPLVKPRAGGKSAVIAASDLAFGLSRMYQAYRETHQVEVPYMSFRTRQEALDWLLSEAN